MLIIVPQTTATKMGTVRFVAWWSNFEKFYIGRCRKFYNRGTQWGSEPPTSHFNHLLNDISYRASRLLETLLVALLSSALYPKNNNSHYYRVIGIKCQILNLNCSKLLLPMIVPHAYHFEANCLNFYMVE